MQAEAGDVHLTCVVHVLLADSLSCTDLVAVLQSGKLQNPDDNVWEA